MIITGNAEVENYKLLLKTESSDNAILELRLLGLAVMVYGPIYHVLQIW